MISSRVRALLRVGSLIVEGQPPDADAATEDVVRFYSENDARLLAATLIGGLAAAFLIWFGGSVFATLRSAEGEPGRVSAIGFGAAIALAAWILATAVWVLIVSVVVFLRQTPTEKASSPR